MRWTSRLDRPFPWIGVLLGLFVCGLPTIALADFNPPSRGTPGRREGGGTRDPLSCTKGNPATLIALNPETNFGLTASKYPRFFWFQPQTRAQFAEFSLYQGDEKTPDRTLVYKTTFKTADKAGIASIVLPNSAGIPPLELGKDYHWSVTLLCNAENPKFNVTVDGWVQRVQTLGSITRSTDLKARAAILAQKGIWFDALEAQAEQHCLKPEDSEGWTGLLRSVKLNKIANQPILCWK